MWGSVLGCGGGEGKCGKKWGGRKKVLREVWEVLEKSVLGCGG